MTISPTAKIAITSALSIVLTVATMLGLAPAPVVCPVCPVVGETVVKVAAPAAEAAPAP